MPVVDKLIPGSFCWMELGSTDQPGAKKFYSSLFGWTTVDFPMGPDGDYTIFRLKDHDCSATYTLRKDQREHGVPPHWLVYIAVSSADESAKRVVELGGKVLAGPFDVMDKGRMAIIQDPTGAHFAIWQGMTSTGIGIANEDGAFCWADINTPDREAAKKFYSVLFGWKFDPGQGKDESGYLHITNGEQMIGGAPPPEMLQPGIPPHWMIYYLVADCDASTAKAASLGGSVHVPPMDIEGAGRMSVLEDPQGASFALFKSTM
jgi:predicted enzyme related to lactoylglutathione lyase